MKFSIFFLIFLFGCTSQDDTSLHSKFIENELKESKISLEKKKRGDEKKFYFTFEMAKSFDKKCNEVITAVSNADKPEVVRKYLEKLKEATHLEEMNDEVLQKNAESAIEELIVLQDYSNSSEIIEQINMINYSYWAHFNETANNNDFVYDLLRIVTENKTGVEGESFRTQLFPTASSSTQNSVVRIGTGFDASKRLTGKIDTLKLDSAHFPVYEIRNAHKGVYDIPAEILMPAANGGTSTVPFLVMVQKIVG